MADAPPHPYADLPARAFWRSAVAGRGPGALEDVYRPRFAIGRDTRVFTAGSCFAQHVGAALRGAGFTLIDEEALPARVPDEVARRYGHRLYSARFGNIYTIRQFRQLVDAATGGFAPEDPVWMRDGRAFDAFRPGVEPDGLPDAAHVARHRQRHLAAVRRALEKAEVLIFTLGLTEAWVHRGDGAAYPTAPGVVAGAHDPARYAFRNFNAVEIFEDFTALRAQLIALAPELRILLTVSPVPLTATASGEHVQVATSYSKSTLRAVCGMARDAFADVDYFPSYEIITSPQARGAFFDDGMRAVTKDGVAAAMSAFLGAHDAAPAPAAFPMAETADEPGEPGEDELVCEERLLDAFARPGAPA